MTLAAVAVLLFAAEPFTLAAPDLAMVGVEAELAPLYTETVAKELLAAGVRVTTSKDLGAVLGVERQKQMLGCSTEGDASCLAELASALGADGALAGEITSAGRAYQLTLKVVLLRDGRPLTSFTGRAYTQQTLLELLSRAGRELAADLTQGDWKRLTTTAASHRFEYGDPMRQWCWVPAALGAVALGAGAGAFWQGKNLAARLRNDDLMTLSAGEAVAREGATLQAAGVTLLSVGGALAVAAAVMFVLGAPPPAPGGLAVAFTGTGLAVSGALP